MRIKYLADGVTAEVEDGYGARLIEQGKAVLDTEKKKPKTEPKPEPKAAPKKGKE